MTFQEGIVPLRNVLFEFPSSKTVTKKWTIDIPTVPLVTLRHVLQLSKTKSHFREIRESIPNALHKPFTFSYYAFCHKNSWSIQLSFITHIIYTTVSTSVYAVYDTLTHDALLTHGQSPLHINIHFQTVCTQIHKPFHSAFSNRLSNDLRFYQYTVT